MAEKNYTVKDVAVIFRKSTKTIYRWIDEGKTFKEYIKHRNSILIPKSEVDRILKEGTVKVYDVQEI